MHFYLKTDSIFIIVEQFTAYCNFRICSLLQLNYTYVYIYYIFYFKLLKIVENPMIIHIITF